MKPIGSNFFIAILILVAQFVIIIIGQAATIVNNNTWVGGNVGRISVNEWLFYYDDTTAPFTTQPYSASAIPQMTHFFLAAHFFNTRNASVLPILGTINEKCPDTKLEIVQYWESFGMNQFALPQVFEQLVSGKLHAIVGFAQNSNAENAAYLASAKNLPIVSHWISKNRHDTKLLSLFPTNEQYWEKFLAFVAQEWGITSAAFLIYSQDGSIELAEALRANVNASVNFLFFYYNPNTYAGFVQTLQQIKATNMNYVFLGAFQAYIPQIADFFAECNFLNDEKVIIFYDLDEPPTKEMLDENENVRALMKGAFQFEAKTAPTKEAMKWKETIYPTLDSLVGFKQEINKVVFGSNNNLSDARVVGDDFFQTTAQHATNIWGLAFDAVITVGMALCNLSTKNWENGALLYETILKQEFDGLSGKIQFTPANGARNSNTFQFRVLNFHQNEVDPIPIAVNQFGRWSIVKNSTVQWRRPGLQTINGNPKTFTIIVEEKNNVPVWLKIVGYCYIGFINLACLFAGGWLYRNQSEPIVLAAQPRVLFGLLVGTILMSWSILFLIGIDDDASPAIMRPVVGCNGVIALYFFGMQGVLISLIYKLAKLLAIFKNMRMKRSKLLKVFSLVFCLMAIDLVIILTLVLGFPISFTRATIVKTTSTFNDQIIASIGVCTATSSVTLGLLVSALVIQVITVLLVAFLAYSARHIPVRFSETKYILWAVVFISIIFIVGIPSIASAYFVPVAFFVICSSLILLTCLTVLIALLLPKMWQVRYGKLLFVTAGNANYFNRSPDRSVVMAGDGGRSSPLRNGRSSPDDVLEINHWNAFPKLGEQDEDNHASLERMLAAENGGTVGAYVIRASVKGGRKRNSMGNSCAVIAEEEPIGPELHVVGSGAKMVFVNGREEKKREMVFLEPETPAEEPKTGDLTALIQV